jgi:hypothetical protein
MRRSVPDDDAFYEAIRPFLEMERREIFEGPCDDDCQVTAEMIDGSSGPFDSDFGAELRAFEKFLQTGIYPSGLYPEIFWDGPQPLPCGGLLSNKVGTGGKVFRNTILPSEVFPDGVKG